MSAPILYSDCLVELTDDSIVFRNYYFPFGSKRVKFSEISSVSTRRPGLWNGSYRLHGTGDLRTGFPRDMKQPLRDKIFVATLPHKWLHIGFTVEDSGSVEQILKDKGLLVAERQVA